MPHNVGYCCINTTLQKSKITYSRDMIKKTFMSRGLSYASELALLNAIDLCKVLEWNADNHITLFRMGSNLFPWANQYALTDLPDFHLISKYLLKAGDIARISKQRITAHPDHFVKLGSIKDSVVANSIQDLELHAAIFDLMNLSKSYYNAINIHVGMNFNEDTTHRWIMAYSMLSESCRSRLVVENDDKPTGYSVKQLYDVLHKSLNIPITFDYFHHELHPYNLSSKDAFELAYKTWPTTITPLFHYSESKMLTEDASCTSKTAHSDYIYNVIDDYGYYVDIDLECKSKELGLFKYRELAI